MASLTRKSMTALGVSPEAQDEIMSIYQEVISEIKQERDDYKQKAEQLPIVIAERDDLKSKLDDTTQSDRISELEQKLTEYQNRELNTNKKAALTALLETTGIDKRGFKRVLTATDLSSIELDEAGNIKDVDKLTEKIKTDWADLIVTDTTNTTPPATPPNNSTETKDPFIEGFDEG